MFETIDAAEIKFPAGLLAEGQRAWQHIKLRLHVPWFYVLYQTEYSDGTKLSNFVFLAKEEQIIDMQSIDNYKIIDIYLVSPGHLNGSDCWKMEKLKEIWTARIKNNETYETVMIYVLQDNSEYTYSLNSDNNEGFIKDKLLIKL
ncbi:MAG: hypothetical protein OQK75_10705 [Gammaproteobacteria bacterium]|nr:hypothetical protein [Gammaproteobacteria bacterium]MCW9030511.1 hypothetical protein [Gammaproteobacteria bacterium]